MPDWSDQNFREEIWMALFNQATLPQRTLQISERRVLLHQVFRVTVSDLDCLNHGLQGLADVVGHQSFVAAFNLIAAVLHQLESKHLRICELA